jgi:hypothetical protein
VETLEEEPIMKRMQSLQQVAINAIRNHLEEVAPEMVLRDEVRINVQLEVDVVCSACGCSTGMENPNRIDQLRCWRCTKQLKKAEKKGVPA